MFLSVDLAFSHLKQHNLQGSNCLSILGFLPAGGTSQDLEKIVGPNWKDLIDLLINRSLVLKSSRGSEMYFNLYPFMIKQAVISLDLKERFKQHKKILHYLVLKIEKVY